MTGANLDGRVALVTGATSGIGEATAYALAASGASVVVTGRRVEQGQGVVETIRERGGTASFVPADVRSASDIDAMMQNALDVWGGLDIAFNNAGIFDRGQAFHEYPDAEWDEVVAVNLTAVFRCMRAELGVMRKSGGGVIVNNASTVAHRGSQRASPAYVAAKHGVLGLTKQAALEGVADGIRVNAVSPGPTLTEVARPAATRDADAARAVLATLNPTGEYVSAEQVAATVVFLCSDVASMINGHAVPVDGGQLAQL